MILRMVATDPSHMTLVLYRTNGTSKENKRSRIKRMMMKEGRRHSACWRTMCLPVESNGILRKDILSWLLEVLNWYWARSLMALVQWCSVF